MCFCALLVHFFQPPPPPDGWALPQSPGALAPFSRPAGFEVSAAPASGCRITDTEVQCMLEVGDTAEFVVLGMREGVPVARFHARRVSEFSLESNPPSPPPSRFGPTPGGGALKDLTKKSKSQMIFCSVVVAFEMVFPQNPKTYLSHLGGGGGNLFPLCAPRQDKISQCCTPSLTRRAGGVCLSDTQFSLIMKLESSEIL